MAGRVVRADRLADAGQADPELRALARARRCVASTVPRVQFDEAPHQRQADAEPALAAIERPLALLEQLEDVRQQLGVDADAVVARPPITAWPSGDTASDSSIAPPSSVYLAALLSRFATHLRQPGEVAAHPDRRIGQLLGQVVAARLDERLDAVSTAVREHRRAGRAARSAARSCPG